MTIHTTLRRAAANVAALGLAAVLLTGCMITSATNLITPDEAATPLPATFTMTAFAYNEGTYAKGEDEPVSYALDGKSYADTEASIKATFAPLDGTQYIVSIDGEDNTIYGVARIEGDVMEIRMLFAGDLATELPTPPAGIEVIDGRITVTDRAGLDAAIALVRDGTIVTDPLVAWIGAGEAPAALVPENGWYKAQ
jgi:hypothetical protein